MVGGFYFDEEITQDTGLIYGPAFRVYGDLLTTALSGGIPGVDPAPLTDFENGLIAIQGLGLLPADYPVISPGLFFAAGDGLTERAEMENDSFSLFAQVDIDLGERATLTLGANYTDDSKDVTFDSTSTDVFSGLDLAFAGGRLIYAEVFQQTLMATGDPVLADATASGAEAALANVPCGASSPPPNCNPVLALQPLQFLPPNVDYPNVVEDGSTDDDDTTWTVRLAYDLTDDMNVYASAATGFKASFLEPVARFAPVPRGSGGARSGWPDGA